MGFLTDRWRRIGTRLYVALGFAVLLTLFSSGVGVYYFERSGDHTFNIQSRWIPVLEAVWSTERETSGEKRTDRVEQQRTDRIHRPRPLTRWLRVSRSDRGTDRGQTQGR